MNCNEADELLGAWALHALPDDESEAMRAHLASCANHAAQAAELRAVADATMPLSAGAVAPPAGLRARILDAVAVTPQDSAVATPRTRREAIRPVRSVGRDEGGVQFLRRIPTRVWIGAMAAAIAGLLIWNVTLLSRDDDGGSGLLDSSASVTLTAHGDAPGRAIVEYDKEYAYAVVVMEDFAPLDEAHTYQIWAIEDGEPRGLGTAQISGDGVAQVPLDSRTAQTIAITIEPAGGSPQPTTDILYSAEL